MTDANQPDSTPQSDSESVSAYMSEDDTDHTGDAAFEPTPIEPERPVPEHVLFVALGVLGTLGLLLSTLVPNLI